MLSTALKPVGALGALAASAVSESGADAPIELTARTRTMQVFPAPQEMFRVVPVPPLDDQALKVDPASVEY